ncbi:MAG: DUF935 family protein [Prevotella sp.]|nr:DUF935 family protein [Prevotella sp.]
MTKSKEKITMGGLRPMPGQKAPTTIIITQGRKFHIDIDDYMRAVKGAENIEYARRTRLYDLYEDILLDTHLTSVIEHRRNALLASKISFTRDGVPDDKVNEQLESPWFDSLIGDIFDAKLYGFTLLQFYKESGWVNYDLIPRKHVDPVRRYILRQQGDISGSQWDEYPNMLFVGKERDLGLLVRAAYWVIYKRNGVADWAQFAEIFGMPIQEYIYETGDDEARKRLLRDIESAGALQRFLHSKDTEMRLVESTGKTASADLYDRLCEQCNAELSKLILGNTLTTEASTTGTQALGTVHKSVEENILKADKKFILNVLNYDMTEIFQAMGIDTGGGKFVYMEPKNVDLTAKMNILVQAQTNFGLPVSDDYLYETFGIEKPKDYDSLKEEQRKRVDAYIASQMRKGDEGQDTDPDNQDKQPANRQRRTFWMRMRDFFAQAPTDGAHLDW